MASENEKEILEAVGFEADEVELDDLEQIVSKSSTKQLYWCTSINLSRASFTHFSNLMHSS